MNERSVKHATFVVERTYDISPRRVFAAWSDREAKARWWGSAVEEFELDFREGGRELQRGTDVHGNAYTFRALYQDIVPSTRIVYTYDMLVDDTRARREHGIGGLLDTLGAELRSGRARP